MTTITSFTVVTNERCCLLSSISKLFFLIRNSISNFNVDQFVWLIWYYWNRFWGFEKQSSYKILALGLKIRNIFWTKYRFWALSGHRVGTPIPGERVPNAKILARRWRQIDFYSFISWFDWGRKKWAGIYDRWVRIKKIQMTL